MSKRMTVIFDDESLYTALKVEAVRTGRHAKYIIADAVSDWLETREDQELRAGLEGGAPRMGVPGRHRGRRVVP